jgi:competence protein ComFC
VSGAEPFWSSFSRGVLDLCYPPKCGLCGLLGDEPICSVCAGEMLPGRRELDTEHGLSSVDAVATLFGYEGRAGQAVQRLKYARVTSLAEPMSLLMASFVRDLNLSDADAFVPVPIHWSRRCLRGFNQSELLSERLANGLVRTDLLFRVRPTRAQAGLKPHERRLNLKGAFRASTEADGLCIVIVDDVITTGYTVQECAEALKTAGAKEVIGVAFAGGG